jgi:AraC family transcriptional regulator of adaptative response/methylated-DNA-[protein]-cysteine methyltransferase
LHNVQLHHSLQSAKATGFRPCRRCNLDGPSIEAERKALVAKACRIIEESEEEPSFEELAAALARSPSYFHRTFKAVTGLTPKDYAAAHRAKKVRQGLTTGNTITEAIYDAGFNSSGRFYEKSTVMLGMTPSQYRAEVPTRRSGSLSGRRRLEPSLSPPVKRGSLRSCLGMIPTNSSAISRIAFRKRISGFVETPGIGFPLDVRGTAFQQRVWQALQEIPAGETVSYAEVARRIGSPKAVRAVAAACAANNLAVAIPCHRVVRIDGSLSGYAWGVERKRVLLDREAQHSRAQA